MQSIWPDFGLRLMSYAVGYGPEVWSARGYCIAKSSKIHDTDQANIQADFWIPIVASFLGCVFGGFLYDICASKINASRCGMLKSCRSILAPKVQSIPHG